MKKFKSLLAIILVSTLFVACSSENQAKMEPQSKPTSSSMNSAELEKLIKDAEMAYEQANKMGAAWRDTKAMLGKARDAIAKQDLNKANDLAQKALEQSNLAMQQFGEQKNAGPYLF